MVSCFCVSLRKRVARKWLIVSVFHLVRKRLAWKCLIVSMFHLVRKRLATKWLISLSEETISEEM